LSARFGRSGQQSIATDALRVAVLNPEIGTSSLERDRVELLERMLSGPSTESTLYLTSAGYFGFDATAFKWPGVDDPSRLEATLESVMRELPPFTFLAVGVDIGGSGRQQQQWWFQGGGRVLAKICRYVTPLDRRVVQLGQHQALGFVCGEAYECDEQELLGYLDGDVTLVAISAHRRVNRIRAPVIDTTYRRWAFQRRLQSISKRAGAALAHAHGSEPYLVRNADNWFVHVGCNLSRPMMGARIS
jgi:hypothetical protein